MKKIILAIHDIHHGNFNRIETLLTSLDEVKRRKVALMFVPRYHQAERPTEEEGFGQWLKEKEEQGHALFLHGCHHLTGKGFVEKGIEPPKVYAEATRTRGGHWVNKIVCQEAEWLGLDRSTREKLLKQGMSDCHHWGIQPLGFVAPTWHGTVDNKSLIKHGLKVKETRLMIKNLITSKKEFGLPLSWPNKSENGCFWKGVNWFYRQLPFYRLALHPQEGEEFILAPSTQQLIQGREWVSYQEILSLADQ